MLLVLCHHRSNSFRAPRNGEILLLLMAELANNGCVYDTMDSMDMFNPFGKTHFTTSDKKHPLTALPTLRSFLSDVFN